MQIACSPKMDLSPDLKHNHDNTFVFNISRGAPLYLSNQRLSCSSGSIEVYPFDSEEVLKEVSINHDLSVDTTNTLIFNDSIYYKLNLAQEIRSLEDIECPSLNRLVIVCTKENWISDTLYYSMGVKLMTDKSFRETIDTTLFFSAGVYMSPSIPEHNAVRVTLINLSKEPITINRNRVQLWAIDPYMNRYEITTLVILRDTVLSPRDTIFVEIPNSELLITCNKNPVIDGMRVLMLWHSTVKQCWVELGSAIMPSDRSQWKH